MIKKLETRRCDVPGKSGEIRYEERFAYWPAIFMNEAGERIKIWWEPFEIRFEWRGVFSGGYWFESSIVRFHGKMWEWTNKFVDAG